MDRTKIGILEDQEKFRSSIIKDLLVNYEIGIWKSAEECLVDNTLIHYNLLLVDIGLPNMNGIEFIKILKPKFPNIKILVLSGNSSDEMIFNAMKYGANGYILKNEIQNLKNAIEVILDEGSFISPAIGVRVLHYFRSKVKPNAEEFLSNREKQVLELVISGLKTEKIATLLAISEGTVRKHINNIYSKLQVSNKIQLMNKVNEIGYFNNTSKEISHSF